MKFLDKEINNFEEPFIVAEISGNHEGNLYNAYELIKQAKRVGADAVKIQCYEAKSLTIPNGYTIKADSPWDGEDLYRLYQKSCTPFEWMPKLFAHAKLVDIPIFSSVFCEEGLKILEEVNCPAYKIASFEANDPEFIKKVSNTGKPVIISTGVVSPEEVERAAKAVNSGLILLHCVSNYPTKLEELSLYDMDLLRRHFDCPIGFSCHSIDLMAPMLAVAKGAAMLELHLKLEDTKGEDDEFSLYPNTFKYVVDSCKKIPRALKYCAKVSSSEDLRRSLYVVENIKKGDIFTRENIKSFRPYLGCDPFLLPTILGHKAKHDIVQYTPMQMEYVDP